MKIYCLLLIAFLLEYIQSELNPDSVVIAINCGGEEFKDSKGINYLRVNKIVLIRMNIMKVDNQVILVLNLK